MRKMKQSFATRFYRVVLTLLGFGSTLMFMACYAPPPSELQYIDDDEVAATDSTIVDDEQSGSKGLTP